MCDENKTDAPQMNRAYKTAHEAKESRFADQAQIGQAGNGYEISDEEKLREIFRYHPPNPSTGPRIETIRSAAKYFAEVILANVPRGADRTAAIRKVREAVMTANAGISLQGLSL
jgi:hypothetical protein